MTVLLNIQLSQKELIAFLATDLGDKRKDLQDLYEKTFKAVDTYKSNLKKLNREIIRFTMPNFTHDESMTFLQSAAKIIEDIFNDEDLSSFYWKNNKEEQKDLVLISARIEFLLSIKTMTRPELARKYQEEIVDVSSKLVVEIQD